MSRHDKIVSFIHNQIEPEFDAEADTLTDVLDSVSLLQLVEFIDQELGVQLELSTLSLDSFATVESLLAMLDSYDRMSA
ncbi:MAG TPA: hypothetical protein VI299_26110 [Polyangiales bacterium]